MDKLNLLGETGFGGMNDVELLKIQGHLQNIFPENKSVENNLKLSIIESNKRGLTNIILNNNKE